MPDAGQDDAAIRRRGGSGGAVFVSGVLHKVCRITL